MAAVGQIPSRGELILLNCFPDSSAQILWPSEGVAENGQNPAAANPPLRARSKAGGQCPVCGLAVAVDLKEGVFLLSA